MDGYISNKKNIYFVDGLEKFASKCDVQHKI
jgi:hypothetical protein